MKKIDQKVNQSKRTKITAAHRCDEVIETANVEQPSPIAAPKEAAPLVPTGFVKLRGRALKLGVLTKTQITGAPKLAEDLASTDQSVFGSDAPSLTNLAAMLEVASAWSAERVHADAWRDYARAQEVHAWGPALTELDALKDLYAYRVKRDPSFAEKHPSLALFYALRTGGRGKKKVPAPTPAPTTKPAGSEGSSNG